MFLEFKKCCWDAPGGLVAKTACSQSRRLGFDYWSGNSDPICHNLDLVQPDKFS